MALQRITSAKSPDTPDTLQDLCICYCVNHLDVLTESPSHLSSLSLPLTNRMLCHCLQNCILTDSSQSHFDMLLQNDNICNSFSLARRYFFSLDNLHELAHNKIHNLVLFCFNENDDLVEGLESLVANNLCNLRSLKFSIKTDRVASILNLLRTFLPGHHMDEDADDETKPTGCFTILNKRFHITAMHKRQGDSKECQPAPPEGAANNLQKLSPNLRSIAISACDLSAGSDFDIVFECLDELLMCNNQLQTISVVSHRLNPVPCVMSAQFPNLQSLVLSCSRHVHQSYHDQQVLFANLPCLQQLKHLDLSYAIDTAMTGFNYSKSDVEVFANAVKSMPQLKSLDMSGTNLSEIVCHAGDQESSCVDHCMPGFEGRRFEYLGLFNCDACKHKNIPAQRVSGNANAEQLLVAVWSFHHNPAMMKHVFDEMKLHVQAEGGIQRPWSVIQAVLAYLEHAGDWDMTYWLAKRELGNITTALFTLYHLKCKPATQQRRALLERLLIICSNCVRDLNLGFDIIAGHNSLNYIVRTVIVLSLHWQLEHTAVYCHMFEQYCRVLMDIVVSRAKVSIKLLVLRLVHSACRISQDLKEVLGTKLELVKVLLEEVQPYNSANTDLVEKMWSILWTLTDEAPRNCETFVNHSGCVISQAYLENTQNHDLHRKISGAMSNVSENAHLRPQLRTPDLVQLFRKLLNVYSAEDEDISSHAASFLVLLASDLSEDWTINSVSREQVLQEVDDTIVKWNINVSKGVRYRSLRPMLNQIGNYASPTAQMWGAWIIDNLVITKPSLYCSMFEEENGAAIVAEALSRSDIRHNIHSLLTSIRDVCLEYKSRRQQLEDAE